ncbi:MAG: hypothetical protein ABDH21_02510 [bacterium]
MEIRNSNIQSKPPTLQDVIESHQKRYGDKNPLITVGTAEEGIVQNHDGPKVQTLASLEAGDTSINIQQDKVIAQTLATHEMGDRPDVMDEIPRLPDIIKDRATTFVTGEEGDQKDSPITILDFIKILSNQQQNYISQYNNNIQSSFGRIS